MSITKEHLGNIAENVLNFLDDQEITSLPPLEKVMKSRIFLMDENAEDYISVKLRPSISSTRTYTVSYIVPGNGIPLEVKINKEKGYSKILFKGDFRLSEYETFAEDIFGNKMQYKKLDSSDVSEVRSELEKLL